MALCSASVPAELLSFKCFHTWYSLFPFNRQLFLFSLMFKWGCLRSNVVKWHAHSWDSLVSQRVRCLPVMQEMWVRSLVRKIPWRRKWHPTPVFLPGKSHKSRSLAGYSPIGSQRAGHDWATSLSLSHNSLDRNVIIFNPISFSSLEIIKLVVACQDMVEQRPTYAWWLEESLYFKRLSLEPKFFSFLSFFYNFTFHTL